MSQVECNKNLFYLLVKWHFYLFAFYAHTWTQTHADRARRSRHTRHTRRMRNMQINDYFSLSESSITAYIECYYSLCWYFLTFLRYLIIWLCKIIDRHSFICLFLLLITLIIKSLTAKRQREREREKLCEAMRHVYLLMIYSRRARNAGNTLDWFARLPSSSWVLLRDFQVFPNAFSLDQSSYPLRRN